MTTTLFIATSIFTLAMAAGVVFYRNAVYSAFCLILSFFGLATLYLLWGAEFVAVIQILIYTGAIVVLFVFVIMLLDLDRVAQRLFSFPNSFVLLVIASVWSLTLILLRVLNTNELRGKIPKMAGSNIELRSISLLLFRDYLWPFEILSVFFLALIVAIFALTHSAPTQDGEENR